MRCYRGIQQQVVDSCIALFPLLLPLLLLFLPLLAQGLVGNPIRNLVLGAAEACFMAARSVQQTLAWLHWLLAVAAERMRRRKRRKRRRRIRCLVGTCRDFLLHD
jgi:hypothetical protein